MACGVSTCGAYPCEYGPLAFPPFRGDSAPNTTKMKKATAAVSISTPAEIVITVTEFRPVLSPKVGEIRDTDYTMRMKRRHPRVSLKDDTIIVKAPGAKIRLIIAAAANDKIKYYPAGITFVRKEGEGLSDMELLGRTNFLQRRIVIDGQTLTFTDRFKKGKDKVFYKFSVIVQRGFDGSIGIIDPGIEHDGTQH